MAVTRPGKVEVDVEAMVAFMSEAGTDRSIDAMLAFCRKCLGANFVSIFTYSRRWTRSLHRNTAAHAMIAQGSPTGFL
jgi:protein tyrosine phosphatase (PTP) superfamily phosphohydrolase (DUF442 family)